VQDRLLKYVYSGFLESVMGPALHQVRTTACIVAWRIRVRIAVQPGKLRSSVLQSLVGDLWENTAEPGKSGRWSTRLNDCLHVCRMIGSVCCKSEIKITFLYLYTVHHHLGSFDTACPPKNSATLRSNFRFFSVYLFKSFDCRECKL